MPTEKEVLTGLLSAAYQIDETGVAELYTSDGAELKPEALQLLLEKDAQELLLLNLIQRNTLMTVIKKHKAKL